MAPSKKNSIFMYVASVQDGITIIVYMSVAFQFLKEHMTSFVQNVISHQLYHGYTNTCTSDNFLTTLLLYCSQNSMFLTMFGLSEAEQALKSGVSTMLTGDIYKGKTTILDFIHSKLTLKRTGGSGGGEHLISLDQKIPCACNFFVMYGNLLFLINATHHTVPVQHQNAVL